MLTMMLRNGVDNDSDGEEMYHQDAIRREHQLEIIKTLGEGTHGKVMLALETETGKKFAVKTIPKNRINSEREKHHIRREIEIQSRLHHSNIISIHEVYESKTDMTLVMEYADGGELFDYINECSTSHVSGLQTDDIYLGGLSESCARRLFRQLVSAVDYLHQNGVVHRDLKLENILLDGDNNAKLADFGLSTTFGHGHKLKTYCGSPLYASPEIVNARPYNGPEVDCWSLGVMLYAMLYGLMPFDGANFKVLRHQITNGLIQQPAVLSTAHGLILHILNPDIALRATLPDILNHEWLRGSIDLDLPIQTDSVTSGVNDIDVSDDKNHELNTDAPDVKGTSISSDECAEIHVAGSPIRTKVCDDKSPTSTSSSPFTFCTADVMATAVAAFPSSSSEGSSPPPAYYPPSEWKESYRKEDEEDTGKSFEWQETIEGWVCKNSSNRVVTEGVAAVKPQSSTRNCVDEVKVADQFSLELAASGDTGHTLSTFGISPAMEIPRNFSADSLEKMADAESPDVENTGRNLTEVGDCAGLESNNTSQDLDHSDDVGDDSENFTFYDVSDIDAVLDKSSGNVNKVDGNDDDETSSQVSNDSLDGETLPPE